MPVQAEERPVQRERVGQFTTVNTWVNPTDLPPNHLADGLNIDLFLEPGVLQSRSGIENIHSSLEGPQRFIIKGPFDQLFSAGATNIYVDGVDQSGIGTTLDSGTRVSMVQYRSLNSSTNELFIANGQNEEGEVRMYRYTSASSFGNWGIDAPDDAPDIVAGTGALAGDYTAVYTYARRVSGVLLHESNPSGSNAAVTLATEGLDIDVVASTDSDVTHIRIYRTTDGGSAFLFDQEVANSTATITSTQADNALGSAVGNDNDRPRGATLLHVLRDRIWSNDVSVPNRLRYTSRFLPESQPANNYLDIGINAQETIKGISSFDGALIVFTEGTIFQVSEVLENTDAIGTDMPFFGGSSSGFVVRELNVSSGTSSPDAIVKTPYGLIYPNLYGIFALGRDGERLLSKNIQSLFHNRGTENITQANFTGFAENMVATYHRHRYYLSYTSVRAEDGDNDYTLVIEPGTQSAWVWDEGFTYLYFDSTPSVDRLYAGRFSGDIDRLEAFSTTSDEGSAISSTIVTPSMSASDPFTPALFLYFKVDVQVDDNDSLTATFYTDETSRHTATITGNRTRELIRLPSSTRGHTWKVVLSFSGTSRLRFHGIETQYRTLVMS